MVLKKQHVPEIKGRMWRMEVEEFCFNSPNQPGKPSQDDPAGAPTLVANVAASSLRPCVTSERKYLSLAKSYTALE